MWYKIIFCLVFLFLSSICQAQQISGTIPEILYSNLSSCSAGLLRDVYIKDSVSSDTCGPGGGIFNVRCSCSFDVSDSTYKWRPTKNIIGASSGGGSGSNIASDIIIVDSSAYYTSSNVEGALQEIGADIASMGSPGASNFSDLGDVGSLTGNKILLWDGDSVEVYSGFNTSTSNFTISPTISSKAICLADGTNCLSFPSIPDSLTDFLDFNSKTISRLAYWDGDSLESFSAFNTSTLNFSSSPTVLTKNICLQDGTNCPSIPVLPTTEVQFETLIGGLNFYTSNDGSLSADDLSNNTVSDLSNGNLVCLTNGTNCPSIPVLPTTEVGLQNQIGGLNIFTANDGSLSDDNLSNNTLNDLSDGNTSCRTNGSNCPSFTADDLSNNNLNDLSNVEAASTDNNFLVYDGTVDNRWESRTITLTDLPFIPLTKIETTVSSQFPYFNTSGILTSTSCPSGTILLSNGSSSNPTCVAVGNQTTIDVSSDSLSIGDLNAITVINHIPSNGAFTYDSGTGTLQIDFSAFDPPTSSGHDIMNLTDPPTDPDIHVYYDTDMQDLCVETASGWMGSISNTLCQIIQYTLTITKAGLGTGLITTTPSGINCGSTCTSSFDESTVVTLNNTPDSGMQFDGYSGNADCSDGSVTMSADIGCTATFSVIPSGGNANNWTSSMLAYWTLDEASGTRVSSGTCGTACNVTEFPSGTTIVNSTSTKVYGTAAAFMDSATNNVRFGCTNTTCTALKAFNTGSTMGDFAVGVWIRPNSTARSQNTFLNNFDSSTTGGGVRLYTSNDGTVFAQLYTASATSVILQANTACPVNNWCHVAVTFDEDTDAGTGGNQPLATLYVNGTSRATNTSLTGGVVEPDSGKLFRLCGTADNPTKFDGYCDDAFASLSTLTSAQICRICRSGVTGEGGVCNGSTPTAYVSQAQTCGSCTPSACNATLP